MSSNGSPLRATEFGVKRSRKAAEPQHLSAFCLSSPEEVAMNPSTNALAGDSTGDHTLNILNLAGAIAMNSLLAINQQASSGGFPSASQLAAQNPLLANAAKMMLSMNLMNAAAASSDRPSASNPSPELLSLVTSQPDATALSVANLQQAMFLQQYAALARGQMPPVNPQLAALQMTLKRNAAENGGGGNQPSSNDRKRSFPLGEVPNQVDELRKRVYSDTSTVNVQRKQERVVIPHVPVSKDDMERCLNRILNEEIYNIFEDDDDLKPEQQKRDSTSSTPDNGTKEAEFSSGSSGSSSPLERKLSIDEILDIIANRPSGKEAESGIASVGSAFRKVASRPQIADSCLRDAMAESPLTWATSVSPADSSPQCSEPDIAPLTEEIIVQLRDLAISHRDSDASDTDPLSTEDQLKVLNI
ncbi:hypothetical protein Q1695_011196 [Nippostrongylus brasiliensis]|nr:hypothetical protein Q1695_011196 [Nippostrongylus brasiliensis]